MAEKEKNSRECLIWAFTGFVLFAAPVFFMEAEVPAGVCGILGLLFFLVAERRAAARSSFLTVLLLAFLAYQFRFCRLLSLKLSLLLVGAAYSAVSSLTFLAALVFDHLLVRKRHHVLSVLSVPAVYVCMKYLNALGGIENVEDVTVYFCTFPVFCQNAKIFGEFGMSYLLLLLLSLAADSLARPKRKPSRTGLALGLLMFLALFVSGSILEGRAVSPDYTLKVALGTGVQNDFVDTYGARYSISDYKDVFERELGEAKEKGADLFMAHEEYFCIGEEDDPEEAMRFLKETVKKTGIPALVGLCVLREGEKLQNRAVLFDKNGEILFDYYKQNLVPYIETSFVQNESMDPECVRMKFGKHSVNVSAVICFDINDPVFLEKVPEETELLLVPGWDWDSCNVEQRRMFFRSVERNTTVVKHSFDGFASVSGPFGLCGEIIDNRGGHDRVEIVSVPIWEKQE